MTNLYERKIDRRPAAYQADADPTKLQRLGLDYDYKYQVCVLTAKSPGKHVPQYVGRPPIPLLHSTN